MLASLDLLIRGAALGNILLIVLGLSLGPTPLRKLAATAVFGLCVACYLLVSSPSGIEFVGDAQSALVLGAYLVPVAFTWAVLEIFFDRLGAQWAWLIFAGLTILAALLADQIRLAEQIRGVLVAALYLGLIYVALKSSTDDLVEKRRIFRRWFVVCMALLGVIISLVEIGLDSRELPDFVYPLQAAAFLTLSGLFGIWAFSPNPEIWPSNGAITKKATSGNLQDTQLINKLNAAMDGGLWREEGLTIGILARRLSVPEHRLRRAINQELGFRNFSTFINGHRIEAAKQALDDPANAGATVLEIAYDCGFASLGPFNKAFRQITRQSPTEYRKRTR